MNRKLCKTILMLLLPISLAGCQKSPENVNSTESIEYTDMTNDTNADTNADTNDDTTGDTNKAASTIVTAPTDDKRSEAQKFVSQISVGWNLGNTLDSHGAGSSTADETYWGNPKTTQEMIDSVYAQGFNTIRIPITFGEHIGEAPDYTIDEKWLNRVQEVVDYAMKNDMFVIIDTHHEPDFWLVPNKDNEETSTTILCSIWKQISERFKDYNDHLIFEGMNEPRVKGTPQEWNGGSPLERPVIDRMNQAFVDTVRSTGGNNESRYLIICTYGNSSAEVCIRNLVIPDDEHIIVSVHMYTPYLFTYQADGSYSTWDGSKIADITSAAKNLKIYFENQGVPVIITEFGAVNKNNEEEVIKWIKDFMTTMNEYGIKCVWWDNGVYTGSGEKFGIFNRKNLSWYSQNIADALINNAIYEIQ